MHEMSLALDVGRMVEKEMERHPGRLVTVGVAVGDNAGVEPSSLVDVGCGSGVLSIAAAKLGFAPVAALDLDEVALEVTAENAVAISAAAPTNATTMNPTKDLLIPRDRAAS